MLVAVKNCLTRLASKWQGVVERNGALQLAFGLVFGVGSGRWRLACLTLTGVQLLGLAGLVWLVIDRQPLGPSSHPTTVVFALNAAGEAFYRSGCLFTYIFVLFYLYKYDFVANVGMKFPCAPLRNSAVHSSTQTATRGRGAELHPRSTSEEDVENALSSCRDQCLSKASGVKLSQSKTRTAVNVLQCVCSSCLAHCRGSCISNKSMDQGVYAGEPRRELFCNSANHNWPNR